MGNAALVCATKKPPTRGTLGQQSPGPPHHAGDGDGKHARVSAPLTRDAAATKIQATVRRRLTSPSRVSFRDALARSARALPRDAEGRLLPLFTPSLADLSAVEGVGTALALRFERDMAVVFGAVFLINLPALLRNAAGDVLTTRAIELPIPGVAGSLGNTRALGHLHGALDAVSTVIIVVAIVVLRRVYTAWKWRVDKELITIADYTVQIRGLPPAATSADVSSWLRKADVFFGSQLVGVTVAFDERRQVDLARRLAAVRTKLRASAQDVLAGKGARKLHLREQLLDEEAALREDLAAAGRAPPRCVGTAFAVFNRVGDAQHIIDEVRRATYDGGLRVRFRRPAEPSDVIWEALHITDAEQVGRQALGLVLSLLVVSLGSVLMSIARFIGPVYGEGQHRAYVKVVSPACLILGNLLINVSVPKIAVLEGWRNMTLRNTAVCVKLALFQVINSFGGAVLFLIHQGYALDAAWYRRSVPMLGAIVFFTILISDLLGLVMLGRLFRRLRAVASARTQSEANAAFDIAADARGYVPKRLSLVLKYLLIALAAAPAAPLLWLLAAVGCALSYAVDKVNLLRQLPPPPHTSGHLVLSTVLRQVLPWGVAVHVAAAVLLYGSRAGELGEGGVTACLGTLAGSRDKPCSPTVAYALATAAVVWPALVALALGTASRRAFSARPLTALFRSVDERYSQLDEADDVAEPVFRGIESLQLYISTLQRQRLLALAARQGQDPADVVPTNAGQSIGVSVVTSAWTGP